MTCIECKKDKMLHSLEIPLCEECYEDMFVLKHEEATLRRIDNTNNIVLTTGYNNLVLNGNGDIILNGRKLATDLEVVEGFRSFLKSAGVL